MGLPHVIYQAADFVQWKDGGGQGVQRDSMERSFFVTFDHGLDSKFLYVDVRAIQRSTLCRQFADMADMQALAVDDAGHFHTTVRRQNA